MSTPLLHNTFRALESLGHYNKDDNNNDDMMMMMIILQTETCTPFMQTVYKFRILENTSKNNKRKVGTQ
jgi:hypothetical protein